MHRKFGHPVINFLTYLGLSLIVGFYLWMLVLMIVHHYTGPKYGPPHSSKLPEIN